MKQVHVTDHALVRWLERSRGIDMELLRSQLAELAQPCVDAGVKHAPLDDLWLIFDGNVLTTVSPSKPKFRSSFENDHRRQNGTGEWADKPHWKMMKRKRSR